MSPASTRHMRQCCCNQLFYISEFAATQARESREAGRGAFGEARGGRDGCTRRKTVTRRASGGMSYHSSLTLRRSSSGSTARILPSVCRHQSNNRAVDNKNARSGLQCLFSKITAPTQHSASSLASTEFILETGPRAQQTAISIHAALAPQISRYKKAARKSRCISHPLQRPRQNRPCSETTRCSDQEDPVLWYAHTQSL